MQRATYRWRRQDSASIARFQDVKRRQRWFHRVARASKSPISAPVASSTSSQAITAGYFDGGPQQ
ncbi:hypothetical protein [Stenotrophomonas hibiscicola]|uniref:hypothetical protein n=1 Tax=Stenotrophomonas hibiscicola TaxID=86189 RepID=UPI003D0F708C